MRKQLTLSVLLSLLLSACCDKEPIGVQESQRTDSVSEVITPDTNILEESQKSLGLGFLQAYEQGEFSILNLEYLDSQTIFIMYAKKYYPDRFERLVKVFFRDLYEYRSRNFEDNLLLLNEEQRYYSVAIFLESFIMNNPDFNGGELNLKEINSFLAKKDTLRDDD